MDRTGLPSAEPSERVGLGLLPGDGRIGVGRVSREPAVEFRFRRVGQLRLMPLFREPVSNLLDQPDAILDRPSIDFGEHGMQVHKITFRGTTVSPYRRGRMRLHSA